MWHLNRVFSAAIFVGACAGADNSEKRFVVGAFLRPAPGRRELLELRASEAADPESANYGHYASQAQLVELVGIAPEALATVADWLDAALRAAGEELPAVSSSGLAHRDAVTAAAAEFVTTYKLGRALRDLSEAAKASSSKELKPQPDLGGIAKLQALARPPDSVELLVTPAAPPGFCKQFTKSGPEACNATSVCHWKEHSHRSSTSLRTRSATDDAHGKDRGVCEGDSDGWVCSAEPSTLHAGQTWRCSDSAELSSDSSSRSQEMRWKRRRRGRRRSVDGSPPASPAGAESEVSAMARSLGFFVDPVSGGMLLAQLPPRVPHKKHNEHDRRRRKRNHSMEADGDRDSSHGDHAVLDAAREWCAVQLSYRQLGATRNIFLRRSDFETTKNGHLIASVTDLTNEHKVDDMNVCLYGRGSSRGGCDFDDDAVARAKAVRCECNATIGLETATSGRHCAVLHGIGPSGDPVSFVVPSRAQTLSALRRELGIPAEAAALAADKASGGKGRPTQAVGQFNDESFNMADLRRFHAAFGLSPNLLNVTVEGPRSKHVNFLDASEGSLDLQVITSLAPGLRTSWFAVDPYDIDGFALAYAVRINDHATPPLVHSISWGDAETGFPPAFVKRVDYELAKAALRGLTVLVSSGDNGISANTLSCEFLPDVLASSPWVTAVGATMRSRSAVPYCEDKPFRTAIGECEEFGPVVCSVENGALITSSGYWSAYRERPRYQAAALDSYLSTVDCAPCAMNGEKGNDQKNVTSDHDALADLRTPCPFMGENECKLDTLLRSKRGSSDVAAPGHNFPIVINGVVAMEDGTSASSPAMAALVSLLNAEQMRRGEPPLGLLNPWLYRTFERDPGAFIDVTVGAMDSTEAKRCPFGFRAAPGWDPATGLGVPRFERLLAHLPRMQKKVAGDGARAGVGTLLTAWQDATWSPAELAGAAGVAAAAALAVVLALPRMRSGRRFAVRSLRAGGGGGGAAAAADAAPTLGAPSGGVQRSAPEVGHSIDYFRLL